MTPFSGEIDLIQKDTERFIESLSGPHESACERAYAAIGSILFPLLGRGLISTDEYVDILRRASHVIRKTPLE